MQFKTKSSIQLDFMSVLTLKNNILTCKRILKSMTFTVVIFIRK